MAIVFYSVYLLPVLAIMAGAAWITDYFNFW